MRAASARQASSSERAGADAQHAVGARLDARQLGDLADVDQVAAGRGTAWSPTGRCRCEPASSARLRPRGAQRGQVVERARRVRTVAPLRRRAVGQRRRRRRSARSAAAIGAVSSRAGGQLEHALAGVEDRPVAGAAAQVARQLVGQLLARRPRCRRRGGARSRPTSDITKPGVQKPHCEPWQSTIACCTGCSAPGRLARHGSCRSSTVNRALPSSVGRNWMQALTVRRLRPPTRWPARRRADGLGRRPARPRSRCRRRNRPRRSLPWCRCSARPRAASRARCGWWRRPATSTDLAAVEEADRARGGIGAIGLGLIGTYPKDTLRGPDVVYDGLDSRL